MKILDVYNGEFKDITIVTDFDTVTIPGKSSRPVKVGDDAVFNAPDGSFYVEESGDWYIKTSDCASGADVEIYNAE